MAEEENAQVLHGDKVDLVKKRPELFRPLLELPRIRVYWCLTRSRSNSETLDGFIVGHVDKAGLAPDEEGLFSLGDPSRFLFAPQLDEPGLCVRFEVLVELRTVLERERRRKIGSKR